MLKKFIIKSKIRVINTVSQTWFVGFILAKMNEEDNMDINYAFNKVIDYIEENICNKIDYEEAAKMMGISVFHFQRLFSFLTGIPIVEYIKYRKWKSCSYKCSSRL